MSVRVERFRAPRELPKYYYLSNFVELTAFIQTHYDHVLDTPHKKFLNKFEQLPKPAQCLQVRLGNRKGCVFQLKKLTYPEIENLPFALASLKKAGLIRSVGTNDYAAVLHALNKELIIRYAKSATLQKSWKKADCIRHIFHNVDADKFISRLDELDLFVQDTVAEVEFLKFLYFGYLADGTSMLTMRDLGIVDMTDCESYEPRFNDYNEAFECYFFARELQKLSQLKVGELTAMVQAVSNWPEPDTSHGAELRDKLAHSLGKIVECHDSLHTPALDIYQRGESIKCTKQVVRLLIADKKRAAAKTYIEALIEHPRSDEEHLYLTDLYERKFNGKKRSIATKQLQASDILNIDACHSGSPEQAVVEVFKKLHHQAYRSENHLWRTLFGLLFWDLLIDDSHRAVHSPFDHVPTALKNGTFYSLNENAIEVRLASLSDTRNTKLQLLKTSTQYYGNKNGVFRWRRDSLAAINSLLDYAPAESLVVMVRNMCKDFKRNRHGYPDVMLLKNNEISFIEVKAPGDQIRHNQLIKLQQLNEAGIPAEVIRVQWTVDPQQVYVVVDVETTGGRGPNHRVTEIGAVKVQGDNIIDRFSTLLNPQRLIPPSITRLTHITNDMVQDAPLFSDIVEEFEQFLEGSIFCAHNVNFDYGFIKQEFQRIGRSFRYPKLCTCASMRKLYKGHRSYSLSALTAAYDIPLKDHHRALCDAEAATHLLLMINEKRTARQTEVHDANPFS